ncbi:MAG: NAD(P)H-hydrate dehydratase [Methylotenera sp. RIFCSPLOWO2_02_FULL_45_14]|nr:MAG: NAD(P)H-hydrate dehydratase [Methylotenera sp. RIFCSPLOWO2_02_FULL_45_14]
MVASMFQPALPPRESNSHKGSFGSVAVIGGDEGMVGAVLLASRAALLSGAGRVYAAMLSKNAPAVDMFYPEIMLRSPSALAQLSQLNCVAIGPGLGQSDLALELLEIWLAKQLPLLLDADALNLLARYPRLAVLVKNRQAETVLTPHAGEAARLLACSAEHVQQNRIDCALQLSTKFNTTCVLKGAGTICAHHDGRYFINTTGNPALATGGTGDVLSGVIASLTAQGLSALDAAKLGVYVHGAAADALVARGLGSIGVTASEVALEVRNVLNRLNKSN